MDWKVASVRKGSLLQALRPEGSWGCAWELAPQGLCGLYVRLTFALGEPSYSRPLVYVPSTLPPLTPLATLQNLVCLAIAIPHLFFTLYRLEGSWHFKKKVALCTWPI